LKKSSENEARPVPVIGTGKRRQRGRPREPYTRESLIEFLNSRELPSNGLRYSQLLEAVTKKLSREVAVASIIEGEVEMPDEPPRTRRGKRVKKRKQRRTQS